jgi:hypothetical protein
MTPHQEYALAMTRRHFFRQGALGLGGAALASLLAEQGAQGAAPPTKQTRYGGLPSLPHFAPKAKRAIYLFMNGGPAQMDLWDHKPKMEAMFDKDLPDSIRKGQRLTTMTSGQQRFPLAPSRFKFVKAGKCGTPITELLPWTAKVVDKLCVINSVHTEAINHDPAVTYICTGSQIPGRPSMGAWLSYGLGSETKDLPAFVVMTPSWSAKNDPQALYNRLWGAGFLPSQYQGVALRSQGDPVLFLSNPSGVSSGARRRMLDTLARLNQKQADEVADPETQARIAQYEMAFRMQSSVPDLMDLSKEPRKVRDTYGPDAYKPGTFAASCLLGRRMLERGVRFVQIFLRGWDAHGDLVPNMKLQCQDIDQATYGLLTDLEQRGMLEDTLVVWGGEFGRTIYCQGKLTRENYGRDHHPRCFSTWMAGGGIKPGIVYGKTDDFSYNVAENPVHIHDMNATILHCLGIDHKKLTFKFQGLDVRLTGVEDNAPVKAILA